MTPLEKAIWKKGYQQGTQDTKDKAEPIVSLVESLHRWATAYPTTVFPEPTPEQVSEVCESLGFGIDRIAAMVLREAAKEWSQSAEKALKAWEK